MSVTNAIICVYTYDDDLHSSMSWPVYAEQANNFVTIAPVELCPWALQNQNFKLPSQLSTTAILYKLLFCKLSLCLPYGLHIDGRIKVFIRAMLRISSPNARMIFSWPTALVSRVSGPPQAPLCNANRSLFEDSESVRSTVGGLLLLTLFVPRSISDTLWWCWDCGCGCDCWTCCCCWWSVVLAVCTGGKCVWVTDMLADLSWTRSIVTEGWGISVKT